MTKVAFLGLGAMGSRMAQNFISAGYEVTVWNRTSERARELVSLGAKAAPTPRAAVERADVVISMLRDDDASSAVWLDPNNGALVAMMPGSIGVECSTLSTVFLATLREKFVEHGRDLVDAPLAGSRPQAEAKQLIFFVGGDLHAVSKVSPILEVTGSAVHHCGNSGAGIAVKLMVNSLFGVQLAAIAELIGFAGKVGVDEKLAVEVISSTPVCSPAVKAAAMAMLGHNFKPAFPIDLVNKDFALIDKSMEAVNADAPMAAAARSVYSEGCSSGFADDNITGIVQLYRSNK